MMPTTAEEWISVANERAVDAQAMLPLRSHSAGPVYLAGYAIECSLKAYLQNSGRAFPRSGREGHNLRALWACAGFRLIDLKDTRGSKTFYINSWSTNIRYQNSLMSNIDSAELVSGARQLTGWIQSQIRRMRKRK